MASLGGNKTEKPTPLRLRKAREQGQFLSSRGFIGAISFGTAMVLLSSLTPEWYSRVRLSVAVLVHRAMASEIGSAEWMSLLRNLLIGTFIPLLKAGAILVAVTVGAHLAITQMGFSLRRLIPKPERFNAVRRLRDLPGQNLSSALEAVALLIVLALAINSSITGSAPVLLRLPFQALPVGLVQMADMLRGLLWKAVAVFMLFGSVDLFRQYQKHMSTLRMTKQEVREELKRNEGDPQIRNRIRRLRRELLRRQMIRQVPKATAVIVNPTHFAVAIRYEMESMASPVVVAKGKNWLALRIRQVAVEHHVPIIENPPLARGLYEAIDVGRAISPEFYKAIAEILAYIYRVMGNKLPA